MAAEYQQGKSLRELAELTGRTQTAVRRALDQAGVVRRRRGAQPIAPPEPLPRWFAEFTGRTFLLQDESLEPRHGEYHLPMSQ
ncbi:MAG: helix-turn-helix domain-containing protein [Dermatophilaceae bacterium]